KITDYIAIMIISPISLIVSGALTVIIQTHTATSIALISEVSTFFIHVLSYVFMCGMFTLLYMIMPNTKVKFGSALFAAFFTTIFFELLKWAYIAFQVGVGRLNAIYGSFAALPLFLIFVQYAWYIVLYGAEIAYSIQNVTTFEFAGEVKKLSVRYKRVMAILICNRIVKNFMAGHRPMQLKEICTDLDLPHRLAKLIVSDLVDTGILSEVRPGSEKDDIAYQPGVSDSVLTVKYVIDKLDHRGVNELPISTSDELATIHHIMADLDTSMSNEKGNLLIRDIS
ncbi:MAG: YihY/virulence factor BrkB family protein, partial [Bacteroidia bacterium]